MSITTSILYRSLQTLSVLLQAITQDRPRSKRLLLISTHCYLQENRSYSTRGRSLISTHGYLQENCRSYTTCLGVVASLGRRAWTLTGRMLCIANWIPTYCKGQQVKFGRTNSWYCFFFDTGWIFPFLFFLFFSSLVIFTVAYTSFGSYAFSFLFIIFWSTFSCSCH